MSESGCGGGENYLPQVPAVVEHNHVVVWHFPMEFSQSRIGGREKPSNACTLITLQLAEWLHRTDTRALIPPAILSGKYCAVSGKYLGLAAEVKENTYCSSSLMSCMIEAIIAGNHMHERAMERRSEQAPLQQKSQENFTIPDAIDACDNVFRELDFCSVKASLWQALPRYLKATLNHPHLRHQPRLFFVMIAFERSVLIVYERATNSFAIFDSHLHWDSETGGLIAMCSAANLRIFGRWIAQHIFPECYEKNTAEPDFELSLIHFNTTLSPTDCAVETPSLPLSLDIFDALARPQPARCPKKRFASDDLNPAVKRPFEATS